MPTFDEKYYRALTENQVQFVDRHLPGGVLTYVNKSLADYMGMPSEDLIGKSFFSFIHPDDIGGLISNLQLLTPENPFCKAKNRVILPDGSHRWHSWIHQGFFDDKGNIVEYQSVGEDITQAKHIQEQLQESELKFRAIFDQAAIGVALVDAATGRLLQVNGKLGEILGMTEDEIFAGITHPDDLQVDLEKRIKLIAGEIESCSTEKISVRKDGTILWIKLTLSAFSLPEKAVGQYLAFVEDITEQKNEYDRFRQSEARLAEAQRIAHIGSWEWYIEANDARWSDETFRIFGMDRGDLDRHRESFLHYILRDDRGRVDKALSDAINGTRAYDLDYRIKLADGTEKAIHAQAEVVRDTAGKPVLMRGTVQDITERKQAEKEVQRAKDDLELLLKTANSIIVRWTPDGIFSYINDYGLKFFGYSREEMVGQNIQMVIPDKESFTQRDLSNLGRTVAANVERHIYSENENITKTGERRWVMWTNKAILDEHSNIKEILTIGNDITLVKLTEEALRLAHNELEVRVQERTAELRNLASHLQSVREEERTSIAREIHDELGQTLAALKMQLSWFKGNCGNQVVASEKTQLMLDSLDATILAVKRICTELRPTLLDDFGIVAAIGWQANEFEKRTGIECIFDEEPLDVEIDKKISIVLYRIFQEALTNIAKHAEATRVQIELVKDNQELMLEIRDNGKGIRREQLARPQTYGLVGMRERIHPWGGTVNISGVEGGGTQVRVTVPLALHDI